MSIAGGFFGGGKHRDEEDDTKGSGAAGPQPSDPIEVDLDSGGLTLPPSPTTSPAEPPAQDAPDAG